MAGVISGAGKYRPGVILGRHGSSGEKRNGAAAHGIFTEGFRGRVLHLYEPPQKTTCLNFGDPSRTHPCAECILMQYVPESRKGEDVPCHHIPLDQEGRTIATLDATEAEEVLKRWLRHEISRLEGELAV